MVPIPDAERSLFLPPLDKALVDRYPLLSWKTAYETLRDPALAATDSNLESFLTDDLSVAQLNRGYEPFGSPTSKTKTDYESRTAAINITSSTTGAYDLSEIKRDALWLSAEAKIDEVHALRIVVLEWRNRPAARILQGYTQEENLSIQKAAQSSDFSASTFKQRFDGRLSSTDASAAPSDILRRANLLRILLSERVYVLRVRTILNAWTLTEPQAPAGRSYGPSPEPAACPSWISKLLEVLASTRSGHKGRGTNFVDSAVTALELRFQDIVSGSGWSNLLEEFPTVELLFLRSATCDVISILQQLFLNISSHAELLPATHLTSWFTFADKYGFFERIQLPFQDDENYVTRIQALGSLVSLQILKFPYTLDYLGDPTENNYARLGVLNAETHAAIHDALWNAAQYGSEVAAPAALAWSIITQSIKQAASSTIEKADDPHSEDEVQSHDFQPPRLSRQGSLVVSNELTIAVDNMKNLQGGESASQNLAKYALDDSGLFGVVTQLSSLTTQLFSSCASATAEIHARVALLELLRQSLVVTAYCSEVVEATLAVLGAEENTLDAGHTNTLSITANHKIASIFLHDNSVLSPHLFYQSQTRYPLEMTPFLELTRALVPASQLEADGAKALPLSEATATFTHVLPVGFAGYEVVQEDEEVNCIKLTEDLPLFTKRRIGGPLFSPGGSSKALILSESGNPELCIPRGTTGYISSESRPPLVMWRHQHSTLRYIGLLLSTVAPGTTKVSTIHDGTVDKDMQIVIIRLISALLNSLSNSSGSKDDSTTSSSTAQAILEEASDDLDRNEDIITVVSDIFENELSYRGQQNDESGVALLSTCLHFFSAVAKVLPNRIWPVLARSAFLGFSGAGSKMVSNVVSCEGKVQQQQVLRESVTLLDALVTDVLTRAVARRLPPNSANSRYASVNNQANGTAQKMIGKVMLAFLQQGFALVQWFCTLPREAQINDLDTATMILRIYDQVIQAVFCFDDTPKSDDKLTAALAPAADYIMSLMSDSASQPLISSLLTTCAVADIGPGTLEDSFSVVASHRYFLTSAAFFTRILEINLLHDTPFSRLEERLLSVLPFLTRLYAANFSARRLLLTLLTAMVRRSAWTMANSASSLSYLASGAGNDFFALLSESHQSSNDDKLVKDVWDFLAMAASSKQQTLVTFVATGETPKNALQRKEKNETETTPRVHFVSIALDAVSQASSLSTPIQRSRLRFLCYMQQAWPGVTSSIRKHANFLTRIMDHLGSMTVGHSKAGISQAYELDAAHVILDILSLYIHNMRQMNDTSLLKQLGPKLSYLKGQGVAIPSYNKSLHSNLKKNFENRFAGCSLTMFKHVGTPEAFGTNYFYDMKFATQLLSFDPSWSRPNGFANEFGRANDNLSLVEAQIRLMGSWKSLAIELSMAADHDKVLQQSLANTVEQCLIANAQTMPSEAIFESLVQSRIELAQVLLQRLTSVKARNPTMLSLLSSAWHAIKASIQDFEIAFVGNNTPNLRLLLGILLLTLQPHTHTDSEDLRESHSGTTGSPLRGRRSMGASGSEEATLGRRPARDDVLALLLEIGIEVVGKGFCSLATQIHADVSSILPSDFALITAIFRSIVKVTDVSLMYTQLTLRLADNNVPRYALALFSWSDRLLGAETDPVIGELSISFIRELTGLPQMAEFLATQGVLSQLHTAPLLNYLRERPSGFGPTDKPARMHVIWARGVLAITLNVLIAVGESFAAEATAFLNSFSNQLKRAATAFGSKAATSGAVTLDAAAEVHTLSLLALALDRYRASPAAIAVAGGEIPELAWDQNGLREDLEGWVNGTGAGATGRIAASSEREAGLARLRAETEGGGAENRLEEMVMEELKGAAFCLGVIAGAREG